MQPREAVLGVILVLAILLANPFFGYGQQSGNVNSYHLMIAERGAEMIRADHHAR